MRWLLPTLLIACSGDSSDPKDDDSAVDSDDDDDTDTDTEPDCGRDAADDDDMADRDDVYVRHCVTDAASRGAVCNDGTTPAYYVDRVEGSTKWLFYFEGGKACTDDDSCADRWASTPHLMSTDHAEYRRYKQYGGFRSADASANPLFADYNRVQLEYCSSDGWAGDLEADGDPPNSWYFRGHRITRAIFEDLLDDDLGDATEIVLSGSSAGASGVRNNADWLVRDLLPATATVRGLHDAGWIPDVWFGCSTPTDGCTSPDDRAEYAAKWSGTMAYTDPVLDESCLDDVDAADAWMCIETWFVKDYIDLPMFVFMDQIDPVDAARQDVDLGDPNQTMAYAAGIQATLAGRDGYFTPCRGLHEGMKDSTIHDVVIDGQTYSETLGNWLSGSGDATIAETCTAP